MKIEKFAKLALSSAIALFCVSSFGFNKFDFYAGASGGFNGFSSKYNITGVDKTQNIPGSNDYPHPLSTNLNSNSANGDLFIGAGKSFNTASFDIRAEADISVNGSKSTYEAYKNSGVMPDSEPRTVTEKNPLNAGISVLPGFYITPNNLMYARVGYRVGSLKSQVGGYQSYYAGDESLKNQTLQGVRVGLGVESNFFQHITLRAEYDYTTYADAKHQYLVNTNTSGGDPKYAHYTSSSKVSNNTIQIGLAYYFGGQSHNPNHYLDPVAWLQNKWGHNGVPVPDEDQTMVASNDQSTKASVTSKDSTVIG